MSTKSSILSILNNNTGNYYSGEELASMLGITRTAVWKAIKALKADGYEIDAVTNKGYCLAIDNDVISDSGISKYLRSSSVNIPQIDHITLDILESTDSTNSVVRDAAIKGAEEGLTVIAKSQTGGRGHQGHSFYSPKETGLYLSLLLRPSRMLQERAKLLTPMSAVAMCLTLRDLSHQDVRIKWVNDLYVGNQKVCGILTEGSVDMENGLMDFCVVGCGVNVYAPRAGFPDDLGNIAGHLFDTQVSDIKNRIAAGFINRLFYYYNKYINSNDTVFMDDYRNLSMIIGKEVSVQKGNNSFKAVVTGIDNEGTLTLRDDSNNEITLTIGGGSIML